LEGGHLIAMTQGIFSGFNKEFAFPSKETKTEENTGENPGEKTEEKTST
jgi:hypothetical protein